MWRLRTTVGLSLLALAVGVGGTAWLSTLTDQWAGPPARRASRTDKVRVALRRHAAPDNKHGPALAAVVPASSIPVSAWPALTPIDMPSPSASFFHRAAPLHGRVVLHLGVDGAGRVTRAVVAQTSGDVALDDRALKTVLGWRFAVPSDRPEGLGGSLVMRFDEGAEQALSAP
jgi:periplasmic protein TonB